MAEDSLKKRYFYKLITNLLGLCFASVTQTIIPRGLGPRAYGDFNFLNNFFTEFINFFDMGTSTAFYTKVSQRPKELKLITFYFYFIGIIALVVLTFVVTAHKTGVYIKLWPTQLMLYIYLSVFLGIFSWITKILNQMIDAYGLTVSAEIAKIFPKIFGLLLISVLFIFSKLNLTNFFFYNYLILFVLAIIFIQIIKRYGYALESNWKLATGEIKKYISEFYQYSHPLFIYSLVGMFVGIFDRWLLQVFGGSIQQGFFSLSLQIGTLCFLFTSAMTPLIMREFSIAHYNKNLDLIASLFRKYVSLLYSITAFFSCFIALNADKVTIIFGGGRFKDATLAVAIMAFFPIHQTYGQLNGSLFYATGQTKLHRNIGIFFMLIGIFFTYFLIAPKNLFGLNAGANGLAIKMVLLQILAINAQLYFNAKLLKLHFLRYIAHQILCVACLLSVAILSSFIANGVFGHYGKVLPSFLFAGFLYTVIVMIIVYYFPILFGLRKEYIKLIKERVIQGIGLR